MTERTLTDLLNEQNAIAAQSRKEYPRPMPTVTKVRMLKDRVINGPTHKTLGLCVTGQVVETAPGYADTLIEVGIVERYVEPEPVGITKEPMPITLKLLRAGVGPAVLEGPEEMDATPDATDAARMLAEESVIELATVTGTGANGRITKGDVQRVIDADASTIHGG